ncbi:MAG: Fic family protein [Leptospiraceae bacterium]|nr:Fic family protein [Leptospiraceae bacterium]
MDIKEFKAGSLRKGYEYEYFMPEKINHGFVWSDDVIGEQLEKASLKLGELNSFSQLVPDTSQFIVMHVYKEAVVSSKIEGTQTNIEEAMIDESEIAPERRDDWQEVNNYVEALTTAIAELNSIPLSNRLLRQTHKLLLSSVRGEHKSPGEFRTSQNWIGGSNLNDAIFIPPIQDSVPELMSDLELFLNNQDIRIPHLIRIAIAHYQFETIHPFLDGNGRIGRLLITLYLVANGIMDEPLLYLSEFLERNKNRYYSKLMKVRQENDLVDWIQFFLAGVIETADTAVRTLKAIMQLKSEIEGERILAMGKRSKTAMVFLQKLFGKPVVSIRDVEAMAELSNKAASDLVKAFEEHKILVETTGYQRNRVFVFQEYVRLFG